MALVDHGAVTEPPRVSGECQHPDTYVGLIEEGRFHSVVHYRCRACGSDIERTFPHGYEGVGG